jgi:hypothetical protein
MTDAITSSGTPTEFERDDARKLSAGHSVGFWLLLAVYLMVSGLAFAAALHFQTGRDYWLAAQTLAIDLGGAIYLVYTHETIRLRATAEEQLRVSNAQMALSIEQSDNAVRPLVIAVPSNDSNLITLKNFGNGSAVNVRIVPTSTGEEADIDFTLKFPVGVSALGPGETATIAVVQYINDEPSPGSRVDLRPSQRDITVEVAIEYSSTHFHNYRTRMYLAASGYEVKQLTDIPPKPVQRV